MVEFALVLPLLILILFGIIEFGFLFAQHLDVRHGAREGGRMASVDYNPDQYAGTDPTQAVLQLDRLIADTCARMDFADGATVTIWLSDYTDSNGSSDNQPGDYLNVRVSADPEQITGLFSPVIDPLTLDSEVEMRIEAQFVPVRAMSYDAATGGLTYSGTCA